MFLEEKNLNPGLKPDTPAIVPADSPEISKRKELIALLRDPSRWPEGFAWDYRYHESCAIGLANRARMYNDEHLSGSGLGRLLGLDAFESSMIFMFAWPGLLKHLSRMSEVTAEHIAQALEATL